MTAAGWFRECYQAEPEGLWRAPGRVNLIGEHTDYNDGWVLPFALGQGVTVAAARRDDGTLVIHSRQAAGGPAGMPLDSLAPGSVQGWAAYPAGVVWALREAGYEVGGASLAIDADLPQGAGLSSSAALECAVALALTGLYGIEAGRVELAAIARRAENEMAGVPSGIMDQSASLLCEAGHALLLDCRSGETSAVPFDPPAAGLSLLVMDTGVRHTLADGSYSRRRDECQQAAAALGVPALRDVPATAGVDRIADPVLRRRARHIVSENERVLRLAALLRAGDLAAAGPLLTASHDSLRDDFEVSWEQADAAVAESLRAGALGARMVGGGFGGSVIVLAPGDGSAAAAAVAGKFRRNGWPEPEALAARPSAGALRVW